MLRAIGRLKDYALCALTLGTNPKEMSMIFWRETKNIWVRLNLVKHNPEKVYSLQTIYGPLYFRDNFGDITNLPNLFYHQVYRIQRLSQPGVILDFGANIGLAAAWFAYHNPDRVIYCFEPLAGNAAMIKLNCPAAQVEQVAVGNGQDRVKLRVDPYSVMASNIQRDLETHLEEFEVISLDKWTEAHGIEKIALMKIDTEGMELDILQGGQGTLQRTHQVAMETHGQLRHNEVIKCLQRAEFHIDSQEFTGNTGMVFASR